MCARFDLQVGDLLSTTLMQLMPLEFAKEVVAALMRKEIPRWAALVKKSGASAN